MVRIGIVEDDVIYQKQLKSYLTRYEEVSGTKFSVTCFFDGSEIVDHYSAEYDILLMDIELGSMDGMTAAEAIRKVDQQVVIIFITNMSQYAIKGYGVEALDYVLKPISYYAFTQRIERALERMKRRNDQYLYINIGKTPRKLLASDLHFIEVQGHTLIYHTADGLLTASGSMSEVEKGLDSRTFFRCNKCYLVNLSQVESIQGDMATVGGEQVQVSRSKKKSFLDALNNYINEVGK
jgi:DNA-binding LytR/AlgR family response regulator